MLSWCIMYELHITSKTKTVLRPVRRIEILSLELKELTKCLKHNTCIIRHYKKHLQLVLTLAPCSSTQQNEVLSVPFINTNIITWLSPLANSSRTETPTSSAPTQNVIPCKWNISFWTWRRYFKTHAGPV